MKCDVCGAQMTALKTDLPFKVREAGIVIVKGLPVLQRVDAGKELEIVRYAA